MKFLGPVQKTQNTYFPECLDKVRIFFMFAFGQNLWQKYDCVQVIGYRYSVHTSQHITLWCLACGPTQTAWWLIGANDYKDIFIKNRARTILKLLLFWFDFFMNKSLYEKSYKFPLIDKVLTYSICQLNIRYKWLLEDQRSIPGRSL